MCDKIEPPLVADGYALSLAFLCLLDIVHCVNALNGGEHAPGQDTTVGGETKIAPSVTVVGETSKETSDEGDISLVFLLCPL